MKIRYLLLFFLAPIFSFAQDALVFNKKFVQSEDKWVAFTADSTGAHPFGFIYIDSEAGLTLDYLGSFTIGKNGKFNFEKQDADKSIKYRLEPNNVMVAFVPDVKLSELGVEKVPDWLKYYKEGENTAEYQYKLGYRYNGWGECGKALEFLNKAYQINPKYEGLKVELAYSHNCLGEYKKAIAFLMLSVKEETVTSYAVKELIFAQAHNGDLKDAENTLRLFDSKITDKTYAAENAFAILQGYYMKKDIANFNRWLKESNIQNDQRFQAYAKQMQSELKQ